MTEGVSELVRILDHYLSERQAGRMPDRAALVAAHPTLAGQLEQALDGLEFIHQAGGAAEQSPVQLGDFRILREVGRGGMGVVYEAEQISLKRRVALKVLRFGAVADETAMQRFQREAETVARLHHTSIVPIFAIGAEAGVRYYAMQFIEGRHLGELAAEALALRRPLAFSEVAHWGLQAAEALAHAHQRGVIHRDIKPSNLILDREGRVWLTDFGLARRMDDVALSVAGSLLGTPRYMSPEQARASQDLVDHRTDIYSLGATLYELATGRPIFEAATPHEVITQILHNQPPAPHVLVPEVSRDLETVILKCLAKEPRHRYATAQALADDLRAFLEGRAISARPPGAGERMVRWVRRHRRTVTVANISAGASLALVLAGYLAWHQHRRSLQGRLMLSTTTPNLVAEVLHADGSAALPAFPVPPPRPLTLPEGTYQVRLSASGLLSQTWPIEVARGALQQPGVHLNASWLWPPRDLSASELPETQVVSLDGPADLVVLTQAKLEPGGRRSEPRLQRLDGATGFSAWAQDLVLEESNIPPGLSWQEWQRMLWPADVTTRQQATRFVDPPPDLDGDGTGDLVCLSRHCPAIGAVSGADGRILWWHRSRPGFPEDTDLASATLEQLEFASLVGQPAVAEVDGDGAPDFFACYTTQGERYRLADGRLAYSGPQSWVSLVSGRTGSELWRQSVDQRWEHYPSTSTDQQKFNALCRPSVVEQAGRKVFLLGLGEALHGWDALTGQPAWPARALGFEPRFAPTVVEGDADAEDRVLLVRRPETPHAGDYFTRTDLELVAWSPHEQAVAWRRSFLIAYPNYPSELDAAIEPFYRVEDLDGDGRPEVLLPVGRGSDGRSRKRWAGLEAIDVTTGEARWLARLIVDPEHAPSRTVDAFVAGPDLNGDGVREVFAAWRGFDPDLASGAMFVAAVSGADGRKSWQWVQPVSGPALSLQWWHAGADGWPLLVVPTSGGPGGQRMTYFLSLADGRLQHTLPDVSAVTPADLDGDGIRDLFYTVYPQGTARHLAVRGEPPAVWQRLGAWQASQDFDGDGFTDLLSVEEHHLVARSGRDSRELWRTAHERHQRDLFLMPPRVTADLDGDHTADFVGYVRLWDTVAPRARALVPKLAAFSGRDGRRLWTALALRLTEHTTSSSGSAWSYDYPLLDSADLDRDGRAEILVAQSRSEAPVELSALDGNDGRILWQLPIVKGGWAPRPVTGSRPLIDLNGDGVLDVVLWQPEITEAGTGESCRLAAHDGRQGARIWTAQLEGAQRAAQLIWPEPVVGDLDGDDVPEVVVAIRQDHDPATGAAADLVTLDGRSGVVRWKWRWQGGDPEIWPPLLIADLDGGQLVCLGVREQGQARLIVLDRGGQLRHTQPLEGSQQKRVGAGVYPWLALDLGGDGRAELVFANQGRLTAARGPQLETVWQWTLPADEARVSVHRGASPGQSAELAVWVNKAVFGLSGGIGQPVWRSEVPAAPRWGMSDSPELRVLRSPELGGLPGVHLWWPGHSDFRWATVTRQAWPAAPDGNYRAPNPRPVAFAPLPEVPAPRRALPWAVDLRFTVWLCSGLVALLTGLVPGWLAYRTVRTGSVLFGALLVVYSAASVGWFDQPVAAAIGAVSAGWMIGRAARNRAWSALLLGLSVGGLCLMPLLMVAAARPVGPSYRWGGLSGVEEWLGESILITLIALPGLALWAHLAVVVRRRQWPHVRQGVVAAGVAAAAVAALWLWVDRAQSDPGEPYAWHGWHAVFLWGGYLAGVRSLFVLGNEARLRWRTKRQTERGAPSAALAVPGTKRGANVTES
jgi:tRNA A-37 threonylcarbamoyl transferase component Bud32